MKDRRDREINYIRLSITDRCNLRCRYCMPATGIKMKRCNEILCYEDLLKIVAISTELGIRKVRVTGGEPLVRKGVIGFIERLSAIPGIKEIGLTTNGLLLADHARQLKSAGVDRVNVSLDSLQEKTFAEITRGGSLAAVLSGLDRAQEAGLKIKLNMVVMRGVNDQEIVSFARLSIDKSWSVRFIEYMPILREHGWQNRILTGAEILHEVQRHYSLQSISCGHFCGPAKPYRISGAKGTIGIITPISDHFCGSCNRIRVTSTGLAKSCLFNEEAVDLKPFLTHSPDTLRDALKQVISNKPQQHNWSCQSFEATAFSMASIGG